MKKLLQASAAAVAGVALSAGLVAAQTGTISGTGPGSNNTVNASVVETTQHVNQNNAALGVGNSQGAQSGNTNVSGNTTGGAASSGSVSNSNTVAASASYSNSSSGAGGAGSAAALMAASSGSISNTGPGSNNQVNSSYQGTHVVTNTNNFQVTSTNNQSAASGTANVSGNTTGGGASSGNVSNSNSSSFVFSASN